MTLVLDAEALSVLARSSERRAVHSLPLAALRVSLRRGEDVVVPAAVLAELYRGGKHDQSVDACLSRYFSIVVVDTDRSLARRIGNVLARAGRGSADHVDASVVAVAAQAGDAVIATADVDDIAALAAGLPGVRVLGV